MTLTPHKIEVKDSIDSEQEEVFNWENCWYPITFIQDFADRRPYAFTLYDEPFVLFRDKAGKLACLQDICPHRAAKLSDGQIIEGKIECLYHGWQFDTEGKCQHIPQLPNEVKIPNNACVKSFVVIEKQGIVWFWRGNSKEADDKLIPTIPNLDRADFIATDCAIDLPYDQSYLIENVIDPAHVHISHHGSLGNRKNAQPLEMEVIESSIKGIIGRYKYTKKSDRTKGNWINLDFIAPNLVVYEFTVLKNIKGGTAIYSLPTTKGSCRLFIRGYSNFSTWKTKLKPRWLSHWETNRILEEDSVFIIAEQAFIEQSSKSMKEIFLPLKTSDVLVVEYRKWLDRYGKNLPFYQGYTTSKLAKKIVRHDREKVTLDRFRQHTQICSSCSRVYQTTIRLKQILIVIAIALAAVVLITDVSQLKIIGVMLSLLSVIMVGVANQVKTKFERSYSRH